MDFREKLDILSSNSEYEGLFYLRGIYEKMIRYSLEGYEGRIPEEAFKGEEDNVTLDCRANPHMVSVIIGLCRLDILLGKAFDKRDKNGRFPSLSELDELKEVVGATA